MVMRNDETASVFPRRTFANPVTNHRGTTVSVDLRERSGIDASSPVGKDSPSKRSEEVGVVGGDRSDASGKALLVRLQEAAAEPF